jgi:hypothetical protein
MKRPGNAVLVRTVLVSVAFASAALLPQTALAGWTWDEMAAVVTSTDGSTARDTAPPSGAPALEGWTWDEAVAPSGDTASTSDAVPATDPPPADGGSGGSSGDDGWTWDESKAGTGSEPAPPPAPAPPDAAAPESAP